MLFIGVNDVGRFENGGLNQGVVVEDIVDNVLGLVADIKSAYDGTGTSPTILLSNLTFFDSSSALRANINEDILDFNNELLSRFDSGWLDDDTTDGTQDDIYATTSQSGLEDVFLLNIASVIDPVIGTDLSDGVHYTVAGNTKLGNFYYDRFENGVVIPEPSSLVLVGLSFVMMVGRSRRRRQVGP